MVISVKVGELRNHLSKYLKRVRQGAEVVITDRDTPVGRVVPYENHERESLELMAPQKGYSGLADLSFPKPSSISAVDELLRERRKR
ncbi:MAG: type II toxin-antitoxin system prevent-host-death family antitoxin [Deltaproteobacteria bacterium]|nr:type II toxin-antitoxin system prevent-host-death family antitoxin [Deltaproteobacteria bacterium]